MKMRNIQHMNADRPTLNSIVYISGGLSALAIIGGIVALVWNAFSPTEMNLFGVRVTTGHVGVAFAALGLICMVLVVRSVMNTLQRLAVLRKDA